MKRGSAVPHLGVRLGSFIAAMALLWPLPPGFDASGYVVQASPFVSVCALLAGRAFKTGMIFGLAVLVIAFFRKRWFCRYACPMGLLLDAAGRIGLRRNFWWKGSPSIGRYIIYLTLAGAAVGYPLFLWTDPLALFSSAVAVHSASGISTAVLSLAGITILLLLSLTSGDLWCARLCPLGALQDLSVDFKSAFKNRKSNLQNEKREATPFRSILPVTRRGFLAAAAGAGLGYLAERAGEARGEKAPLRPPGAVGEDTFAGKCVRCGNCLRACPSDIIRADTGQAGITGLLAPIVRYESDYCLEDCNACTRVCPSGALQTLDMERKRSYVIGEALVDGSLCYLVRGVNDCDICVRSCPYEAVEVYWDEELYVAYPRIDPGKCNGCGACEVYCPTGEVKAIRVWKRV